MFIKGSPKKNLNSYTAGLILLEIYALGKDLVFSKRALKLYASHEDARKSNLLDSSNPTASTKTTVKNKVSILFKILFMGE